MNEIAPQVLGKYPIFVELYLVCFCIKDLILMVIKGVGRFYIGLLNLVTITIVNKNKKVMGELTHGIKEISSTFSKETGRIRKCPRKGDNT
jgi:hypothetical protein